MNTPSHHRVHHATNPRYLDTQLCRACSSSGTGCSAPSSPSATTSGRATASSQSRQLQPALGGVPRMGRDREGRVVGADLACQIELYVEPPGWSHDGSRDTSETIKAALGGSARPSKGCSGRSRYRRRRGRIGRQRRRGPAERGRPLSVALLEAGGRNTGLRTRIPGFMAFQTDKTNWRFETVPQPGLNGRRGYQPRGRGLGGSSAINAMLYMRGNAWDYDNWAAMGCPGWSYDDVLPWFKRAEANERGARRISWRRRAAARVSDQRSPHPGQPRFRRSGAQPADPGQRRFQRRAAGRRRRCSRSRSRAASAGARARAYLEQAARERSTSCTDAIVERVLFDEGRAWGVAYRAGRRASAIVKREARGGAGGRACSGRRRLLMLSGIGPAAHLARTRHRGAGRPARGRQQSAGPYRLRRRVRDRGHASSSGSRSRARCKMAGAVLEWFRSKRPAR